MSFTTPSFSVISPAILTQTLVLENGGWKIQWDDSLILPELAGGKHLVATHVPPARGDIYDRNGNAIVTQTDADALGLVAGEVSSDHESALINPLFRLTGIRPETIRSAYENYQIRRLRPGWGGQRGCGQQIRCFCIQRRVDQSLHIPVL